MQQSGLNWRLWAGLIGAAAFAAIAVTALALMPATDAGVAADLLPGAGHWLGTDGSGRDLAALLMLGSLTSVMVAGFAAVMGLVLALPVGLLAAVRPGLFGWLAEGASGLLLPLAPLVVVVIGTAAFHPHASIAAIAVGVANFGQLARLIHRTTLELRPRGFIVAARLAGAGSWAVAWRHLLPGALPAIAVTAIGQIATGIVWEATLSFAGLGAAPPRESFGLMLADTHEASSGHAWELLLVTAFIIAAALSFRLLAEGVGRALARASGELRLAAA